MLLILTESKSIDQSDSRILQQLHRYFLCWTQPMACVQSSTCCTSLN